MYPLDVTTPQAGCCVAGGLELGAGSIHGSVSVRGHRPASGVRLVRVSPNQTCYRMPGVKRVRTFASSGGRAPCLRQWLSTPGDPAATEESSMLT